MNSVVHFEMPYVDSERMAKFYHSAFGWETKHLGEGMGDYMLATTTGTGEGPGKPGAINGGFFPKQSDRPSQGPSIVIAVDDMDDAIERVKGAGGHVLGEPMEIPGVGRYVSFTDPEGNQLSMLQPAPSSRQEKPADDDDRESAAAEPRTPRGARVGFVSTEESQKQEWSPKRSSQRSSTSTADEVRSKARGSTPGAKSKTSRRRSS